MRSMRSLNKSLAVLLLGGGATGAFLGIGAIHSSLASAEPQKATQQQVSQAEDLATVFRDIGKQVEPSVVEIVVRKTIKAPNGVPLPDDMLRRFFPNMPEIPDQGNGDEGNGTFEQQGTGSGVIMEVDGDTGYILTNNHVAGGATDISVHLASGRVLDNAKLVGADPKSDLAVVKITADDLKAAHWGDSSTLQQGDWIMAFGAPFGYVGSMSHGIVSALNRNDVGILGRQGYEDFIQVDAPINPGNSGGPLVNLHGDVVGINTAIASRNGGFQGIGFAIPINEAKFVYHQLKEHGKVVRGWLGVAISDLARQPEVGQALGYSKSTGVLVKQILPGTPAYGKLEESDIITAVNGHPVANTTQLRNEIAADAPGTSVGLTVYRNGGEHEVAVKLGEQPENMLASQNEPMVPHQGGSARSAEALGMRLSNASSELSQKFGLPESAQGAVVTYVVPRSPAEKANLQIGEVITHVDRKPVKSAQEALNAIAQHKGNRPILLYVATSEGSDIVAIQPNQK